MAWTLVQHPKSAPAASPGTVAITPTSGNLLVVMLDIGVNAATPSQPTGMAGASWTTVINHATNATVAQTAACFIAVANTSSAITISASWTGGGNADMVVAEFSNPAGVTTTLDGTLQTTDTTTAVTPVVLPTYTPGVTGDLVIHQILTQNNINGIAGSYTAGDVSLTNTADAWGYALNGTLSTLTPSDSTTPGAGAYCSFAFGIKVAVAATTAPFPVFLPRNTTGRGVRNLIAMRRYAQTPPALLLAGVTFTDAMAGALIFGGTVQEAWTWAFPRQSHSRRLPIARGLRDPAGLRGYTRTPVALRYTYTDTATGAWIFTSSPVEAKRGTDALSGAWIFAGSRVEAKRGTDARTGSIIFGGTRAEAITFVQARSGSVIFGGSRTELKRGTDAQAGSVIFGGSRTELKRYGDVRSGAVTFGGSATQLRVGTDARTGTIIFGGHSSTAVTTTARVKVTYIIPDARGRRRRTRW